MKSIDNLRLMAVCAVLAVGSSAIGPEQRRRRRLPGARRRRRQGRPLPRRRLQGARGQRLQVHGLQARGHATRCPPRRSSIGSAELPELLKKQLDVFAEVLKTKKGSGRQVRVDRPRRRLGHAARRTRRCRSARRGGQELPRGQGRRRGDAGRRGRRLEGPEERRQPDRRREPPRRDRPPDATPDPLAGRAARDVKGCRATSGPAFETSMMPAQMHISLELSFSAGMLAISTVGAAGRPRCRRARHAGHRRQHAHRRGGGRRHLRIGRALAHRRTA